MFGSTTFDKIQKSVLFSSFRKVYQRHQRQILNSTNSVVQVPGNGEYDSSGYSAKYDTYIVMDISTGKELNLFVVHLGTVENVSKVKLKIRIICLTNVENTGKKIHVLTTNRRPQIKAYMRNQRKDIKLQFDVWHVSKNI